jgi:hypothetical protein
MDDGKGQATNRGTKRPAGPGAGEGGKRRAPYAIRACDVCRRRKGKCNGRHPCGHCSDRSLACSYTSATGEPASPSLSRRPRSTSHQLRQWLPPPTSQPPQSSFLRGRRWRRHPHHCGTRSKWIVQSPPKRNQNKKYKKKTENDMDEPFPPTLRLLILGQCR